MWETPGMAKGIRRLFFAFLMGFAVLAVWLSYWQVYQAAALEQHPRNPRLVGRGWSIERGGIYTEAGEPLALSTRAGNRYTRHYVGPPSLVQTIGYAHPRFGKTGLEWAFDEELLGLDDRQFFTRLARAVTGEVPKGNRLITTLNMRVQRAAEEGLQGRRGAAVVMNPQTGAVIAMAGSPSFDPSTLSDQWEKLVGDPSRPLVNRATQGLYPPGSAFKVAVLAEALEQGIITLDERFDDPGTVVIGGYRLSNYKSKAYGNIDVTQALAVSSNVVFAQIGMRLGAEGFETVTQSLGFGSNFGLEIPVSASRAPTALDIKRRVGVIQLSIGQGELLVTPLQMAMLTATIANRGVMMRPHLLSEVRDPNGRLLQVGRRQILGRPFTSHTTDLVTQAMEAVVLDGTGKTAAVPGVRVAGKTGSAENPHGRSHSWFIAFAPVENPTVALAVVVENAGTGAAVAAPLAQKILVAALQSGGAHASDPIGSGPTP